jgi:hypothetical protein
MIGTTVFRVNTFSSPSRSPAARGPKLTATWQRRIPERYNDICASAGLTRHAGLPRGYQGCRLGCVAVATPSTSLNGRLRPLRWPHMALPTARLRAASISAFIQSATISVKRLTAPDRAAARSWWPSVMRGASWSRACGHRGRVGAGASRGLADRGTHLTAARSDRGRGRTTPSSRHCRRRSTNGRLPR